MDVGNPSKFVRILEIFKHQFPDMKKKLISYTITDEETKETIRNVFNTYNYVLDPHGAVGFLALHRHLENNFGQNVCSWKNPHPVKFPDAVRASTGRDIGIPTVVKLMMQEEKKSHVLSPGFCKPESIPAGLNRHAV